MKFKKMGLGKVKCEPTTLTPEKTNLRLHEVEFCSTCVHQSVEVLVARELRFDQSTNVSLKKDNNI